MLASIGIHASPINKATPAPYTTASMLRSRNPELAPVAGLRNGTFIAPKASSAKTPGSARDQEFTSMLRG